MAGYYGGKNSFSGEQQTRALWNCGRYSHCATEYVTAIEATRCQFTNIVTENENEAKTPLHT